MSISCNYSIFKPWNNKSSVLTKYNRQKLNKNFYNKRVNLESFQVECIFAETKPKGNWLPDSTKV